MKRAITIFLFLSICIYTQAQNLSGVNKKPSLKIECVTPTVLSLGQSIKLKVKLRHNFPQEKTGQLTLALINHRTKISGRLVYEYFSISIFYDN